MFNFIKTFKDIKLLTRVLFLIFFILIFLNYFLENRDQFSVILQAPWHDVVLITLLQLVVIITNTLMIIKLLVPFRVAISIREAFDLIIRSSAINFFGFLQGGTGYRAYYLNKKYKLKYKKFMLLFMANYIIIYFVSSALGLLGILLSANTLDLSGQIVVIFFISIILVLLILLFMDHKWVKPKNRFFLKLKSVLAAWNDITRSKKLLLTLLILAFLQYLSMVYLFKIELDAINQPINWFSAMGFAGVANFSLLIALTPGAIGFRESLLLFSKDALGITNEAIIISSTIDRLIYFFLLLSLVFLKPLIAFIIRLRFFNNIYNCWRYISKKL